MFIDGYCLNDPFRFWPGEVDRQQPVLQVRTQHLHPLRQHEGALEVARGDAAMDVLPGLVVLLAAANDELVFLNGHIELVAGKTRYRQRDAQALGLAVGPVTPLDVVGRIAIRALHDAIERTLDFVESKQKRAGERRNTRHQQSPLEATLTPRALSAPSAHARRTTDSPPDRNNMAMARWGFKWLWEQPESG